MLFSGILFERLCASCLKIGVYNQLFVSRLGFRKFSHFRWRKVTSFKLTGAGGFAVLQKDKNKLGKMKKVEKRLIKVAFTADVQSSLQWEFQPQQSDVWVYPGETALAFYRARNPTDRPIVGISTYTIIPYEAGQYFAKIQCFCFEEQILNPGELVDMPVFFYIDPDFVDDPFMEFVDTVNLCYTFFESKEGLQLPMPLTPQDKKKTEDGL